jgi:hypothetical protein
MGARFTQYLAVMERGGRAGPAPPGVERVLYVLACGITVLAQALARLAETGGPTAAGVEKHGGGCGLGSA